MSISRRGSYTTSLGFFIVLLLGTLLFGVLAYVSYNEAVTIRVGKPDDQGTVQKSLQTKKAELAKLESSIASFEERIKLRQHAIFEEDLVLAGKRSYYDEGNQAFLVGNQDDKTDWNRTAESIRFTLAKMQSTRAELESTRARNATKPLEDLIRQFREETQQVLVRMDSAARQMQADRDNLERQLSELEAERARQQKEFDLSKSTQATRKSQLEQRIRELLELKLKWLQELEPDGRILEVARSSGRVMIDAGSKDRVLNGMPLEVFQYVKGRYVKKGMIEVIEIDQVASTCRIVEELDPRWNPIAKGDLIGSPVYHRAMAKTFVLEGEFHLYNREDLAYFLRRSGAEVRDQLGPGVDFMIAGDRSEPAQDRARQFHTLAMTEAQLVQYLNTNFPPRSAQEKSAK